MRFLRMVHSGVAYYARVVDDATARLWTDAPWSGGKETDRLVPLRADSVLAPIVPSKVLCVGRNYAAHAKELGNAVPTEPLLFLKPPSSLLAHGGSIVLPLDSERVEHEGELGVVLARDLRHASENEARDAIFGLTCVNDVTARDLQKKDVQFTRAKGFDTFCPVGPHIETDISPDELTLTTRVNGVVRQHGNTRDMVFSVSKLLAYMSRVMTLCAGDLIVTGTPEGVGPLVDSDVVEVEIEKVGLLRNRVQSSRPSAS